MWLVVVVAMKFFVLGLTWLLSACGNPFGGEVSHVEVGHNPGVHRGPSTGGASGGEFVSMSAQRLKTTYLHYQSSQSLGGRTQAVQQKTSRGYTVYSNIQGELISLSQ